jgi:hypothetical protein
MHECAVSSAYLRVCLPVHVVVRVRASENVCVCVQVKMCACERALVEVE